MQRIFRFWSRRETVARGQSMTEYVFVVAAIAIVVVASYVLMGQTISNSVTSVNTVLFDAAAS